jgi:hypothetical protein
VIASAGRVRGLRFRSFMNPTAHRERESERGKPDAVVNVSGNELAMPGPAPRADAK